MRRPQILAGLAATACLAALAIGAPAAAGGNVNCTTTITGGTINGNVTAGPGCDLEGTHVKGNVAVQGNGSLTANGATIDGNLQIQNDSGANTICGTTVGGNLQVHNNSGTTSIGVGCPSNSVGGNLEVHNNTGQVTVSNTAVGGNLDCHSDSPAASTGTGGDTVGGKTTGNECSTSMTVPCPASGCSVEVSDGNTDVTVYVPGGGHSGNLTVTLVPPPANDGCDVGEGSDSPSGDVVVVNPPGGYGPDNPIEVDITYNQDPGFFFAVCKSDNGGKTYFPLPTCNFDEEGPPSNVPCFVGEEFDPTVYITSNDPSINGHA